MLRTAIHYFVIGGLLFGGKALYESRRGERPEVSVRVPADATPAQIQAAIDEAILLNEARRYGWDRRDPVVFSHLVRNMRFVEPDSTDDDLSLYARALDMDMHRHDPIVRARLLYRAREALAYVPEDRMPTREALERHRAAHPERFEREGRVRFHHVFLSRSKRGQTLPSDARAIRARLEELGEGPPSGVGDPLPGVRAEQRATVSKIRAEYGSQLASLVEEPIVGVWRGPVSSVYGLHFIRVVERQPAYVPPLDVIGTEVRADMLGEIREALRKERMANLRDAYVVHLEEKP
jgi:hypothetical protein